MLITVMYQNGKYGLVDNSDLYELIYLKKIKKFLRSDDWCTLGIDPLREGYKNDYKGQERRQSFTQTNKIKKS